MNLPNKLTVSRMIFIPVFMAFLVIPPLSSLLGDILTRIISAVLFALISLTDMVDGKIARKYHLETNFGRFMDPLADKMLVLSAFISLLVYLDYIRAWLVWAAAIVILRELAVTGMRLLVVESAGQVIAAKWLGKVKTVTQMTFILTALLEPVLFGTFCPFCRAYHPFTYLTMVAMTVMTVWSGINYFRSYSSFINPTR